MSSFTELISARTPILVDFTAQWCGPCKTMAPILEQVKKMLGDKIRIIKVDIDKNPSVSGLYQVQSVPTLIIFQEGTVRWRQSGVIQAAQLKEIVEKYI